MLFGGPYPRRSYMLTELSQKSAERHGRGRARKTWGRRHHVDCVSMRDTYSGTQK
jgi:hypothetical protein